MPIRFVPRISLVQFFSLLLGLHFLLFFLSHAFCYEVFLFSVHTLDIVEDRDLLFGYSKVRWRRLAYDSTTTGYSTSSGALSMPDRIFEQTQRVARHEILLAVLRSLTFKYIYHFREVAV